MTKSAIIKAFGTAAARYDGAAGLQRQVAQDLANRIAALPLASNPRVLEIGCGTGFLGQALAPLLVGAQWVCTDIAEAMVARARAALPAGTTFAVMDGEAPCFAPGTGFDLICGNLAMQWFRHPASSLPRLAALLRPGGYLVFSTLGEQSFSEWRQAMQAHDLSPGTAAYPSASAWRDLLPGAGSSNVTETLIPVTHETALAFLRELKQIGASTPGPGYGQLGAGQLRRVLRGIAEPFTATYHVVFATYRAPT